MSQKKQEITSDEGIRSFGVVFNQIADGGLELECAEELHKLLEAISEQSANTMRDVKGKLTITLDLKASSNGVCVVLGEVKIKCPPKPKNGQHFWITKGNNLSAENPKQTKLPLRDVSTPNATRDVASEKPEVRHV